MRLWLEIVTEGPAIYCGTAGVFSKYDNLDSLISRVRAELKLEPQCDSEPEPEAQKSLDPAEG